MSESPKRQAPAFQFYADDFIAGTVDMSPAEVGAYIRLLCYQWSRGSAPALPEKMQRVAGGIVSDDVIAKFPLCEDGNRRNKRLEDVRKASDAFRKIQAEKAHARWKKDAAALPGHNPGSAGGEAGAMPNTMPDAMPNACSPSPSPSPIPTKDKAPERSCDPTSQWHVAFGLELPESLRTSQCLQALNDWLAYKTERRQGYKKSGLKAALSKWANEFTSATFPTAVENSMANNWQGIFPASQPRGQQPKDDAPKPEDAPFIVGGYDWRKSL